jgi:acetylornithine deacetylase/succinyl-diaminopimelate desuccinylase-like protein
LNHDYIRYEDIEIIKGNFNASPAMVDNDAPFVKFVEKQICSVSGIDEFIHQYHGGSDIRLPMLYGHSQCVGIGPSCHLPLANEGKREYISVDDYITGIKILASILYHYPNMI